MEEETVQFYSETQTEQKMQFGADSAACNVNQWDLYNSIADPCIKLSEYLSSLYISNNMS